MNSTKAELRTHYRQKRSELTAEQIDELSMAIVNRCLALDLWDRSIYHLFMSSQKNNELDTSFLLSVLQGKDKQPVIPKMAGDNELEHYLLTDQTPLKENRRGIPEPVSGIKIKPEQIDIVFVPLLIFDLKGHRVGYGQGYYDRFLAQCGAKTVKVGLSFFDPVPEIKDVNAYDVPLDHCLTPGEAYHFK